MTHPEKWYIPVTDKNYRELYDWWRKKAEKSGWMCMSNSRMTSGDVLVSEHPTDRSYYWFTGEESFNRNYPSYQKITLKQFREITTQTPMSKTIRISRELLNEYYEVSTTPQRSYLIEHFKLDGTTSVDAIRGLYEMACETWKPRIKKNHPECFEEDKHFYFSESIGDRIVSPDVCGSLGLADNFIQIKNSFNLKIHRRSFYLSSRYNWKLVNDDDVIVLIPTKK